MVIFISKQGLKQEGFINYLTSREILTKFLRDNHRYSRNKQVNLLTNKGSHLLLSGMDSTAEDDDQKGNKLTDRDDRRRNSSGSRTRSFSEENRHRPNLPSGGPSALISRSNMEAMRKSLKDHEGHIDEVVHKYSLMQRGSAHSVTDDRDRSVRCDAKVEINISPDPLVQQVFNDEFESLEVTPPISKTFKSKKTSTSKVTFNELTIQHSRTVAISAPDPRPTQQSRFADAGTQTEISSVATYTNERLIKAAMSDKATGETNTSEFSMISKDDNDESSEDADYDTKQEMSSLSLASVESLIRVRRLQGGAEPQLLDRGSGAYAMHPQQAVNLIKGACSEEDLVLIISPYGSDKYETSTTVEIHAINKALERHCGSFCMPKRELPILDECGILKKYYSVLVTKKLDEDNSIRIISRHLHNLQRGSSTKSKTSFLKVFRHLKRLKMGRFCQSKYCDDVFRMIDDLEFEIFAFPTYNKKGNHYTLEILSHNNIYLGSLQVRVDEIVRQLGLHPDVVARFNIVLDINMLNSSPNTSVLASIAENLRVLRLRDEVTKALLNDNKRAA